MMLRFILKQKKNSINIALKKIYYIKVMLLKLNILKNQLLKEFIKKKKDITLVCLDGVTDPRNIGALIRSAASFNIDGIIIKERNFPK